MRLAARHPGRRSGTPAPGPAERYAVTRAGGAPAPTTRWAPARQPRSHGCQWQGYRTNTRNAPSPFPGVLSFTRNRTRWMYPGLVLVKDRWDDPRYW